MKKLAFILLITGLLVLAGCADPTGPSALPSGQCLTVCRTLGVAVRNAAGKPVALSVADGC